MTYESLSVTNEYDKGVPTALMKSAKVSRRSGCDVRKKYRENSRRKIQELGVKLIPKWNIIPERVLECT